VRSEAEHRGDALRQLQALGRVSVPNAAVLMGIHPYTLREYIERGYIQTIPIGKRHWVTEEEIEHYRVHGKRTPESAQKHEPCGSDLDYYPLSPAARRILGGD